MKYLIVVAHPDDEVLGCGASIYKWTKKGDVVDVCIMCTEAKARAFRPDDKELDDGLLQYPVENQGLPSQCAAPAASAARCSSLCSGTSLHIPCSHQ